MLRKEINSVEIQHPEKSPGPYSESFCFKLITRFSTIQMANKNIKSCHLVLVFSIGSEMERNKFLTVLEGALYCFYYRRGLLSSFISASIVLFCMDLETGQQKPAHVFSQVI